MIAGISIGEYIRNRRLSLAGQELCSAKIKVIDTALKYGYETPEGFTKAFTRFHGFAPSAAREAKEQLKVFNPISITINNIGVDILDYKIEVKNEFIGDKSKHLGDIDITCHKGWDEGLHNDLMCAIVAAMNFKDESFDTTFVAGASGAAFGAYWSFGTNNCSDFLLMGDKLVVKTFQNLGLYYTHYRKSVTADWENIARSKIVESLDNNFPALVRFYDGYGVIGGYDNNGKILHGCKMFYDDANYGYFPRSDYGIIDNVIIINSVNSEITRQNLLMNCLEWDIHMANLPEFFNYENDASCVNGIACYDKVTEVLQNDALFDKDEKHFDENKMRQLIFEHNPNKYVFENGDFFENYNVFLRRIWGEIFCDFSMFNHNKRRFASRFLRVLAKEFNDICVDELEKAAAEYDKVYEIYDAINKDAGTPFGKTEDEYLRLNDINYRSELIDDFTNIKEHEKTGVSYMQKALRKIKTVTNPNNRRSAGDVN